MKPEELKEVLQDHKKWVQCEGGKRAYLRHASLESADLRGASLESANLRDASLESADLRDASLRHASLRHASLESADLRGAILDSADLWSADLRGANLQGADLRGANLDSADLWSADLRGAILPMYCKWPTGVVDNEIKIGCITKSPEEWEKWLASNEEYETKRGTGEFKQIEAVIRAYIAYLKVLNS